MSKAKRRKVRKVAKRPKDKKNLRLRLVYEPIEKLEEWAKNPRINDEAAEKLCELIEEYGFINPIIASPDGTIRAGHTKIKSAKQLGYTELPVLYVPFESEKAAEMFAIADNKSSEWADWDKDLLDEQFFKRMAKMSPKKLKRMTGFSQLEIEEVQGEKVAKQDKVPEPPKKAYSKEGDLWLLGKHRVLCGDALSKKDASRLMNKKTADMTFTDPPYNIAYNTSENPRWRKDGATVRNDQMSPEDWRVFCNSTAEMICEYVDGCVYVCHAPGPDGRVMAMSLDAHLHSSTTIIWRKDRFTLGRGKYQNQYEPIWFGWTTNGSNFSSARDLSNTWDVKRPGSSDDHPTMKPIELVSIAIEHASQSGMLVSDFFLGAGSTLIAADQLDRICYGMEIEPVYVDVTVLRWQRLTGKTPVLLRKGKRIRKSLLKKGDKK